ATGLCEAKFATLWLCEGNGFRSVALHNAPPAYVQQREREPVVRPGPATALGRVAMTKQVVQFADLMAERAYREGDPVAIASVQLSGTRTWRRVRMLNEGNLIGAISIYRREVRPFTKKSRLNPLAISPSRGSPQSRTPACSTSCANRCSSRPPPPTCSRSSAARRSILSRCFRHWSNQLPDFVRLTRQSSVGRKRNSTKPSQATGSRPTFMNSCNITRSRWVQERSPGERLLKGEPFMFPMYLLSQTTKCPRPSASADIVRCWVSRCCGKDRQLA